VFGRAEEIRESCRERTKEGEIGPQTTQQLQRVNSEIADGKILLTHRAL